MNETNFRSAAVALVALAAGLAATPAFARSAPAVDRPAAVQPGASLYSCGAGELRTRLQRRFCGVTSVRDDARPYGF